MVKTPKVTKDVIFNPPWHQRAWTNLRDATFPIPPLTCLAFVLIVLALHYSGIETLAGYPQWISSYIGFEIAVQIVCATTIWLCLVKLTRFLITLALYYRGWLADPMGKPSPMTKAFFTLIGFLQKCKPTFHTFQGLLPARPLPSVSRTVELYLKSVRPTMTDEQYDETVKMADEFLEKDGKSIQSRLYLKWLTSANYMDDWWKTYVYNSGRDSLLYSNISGNDIIYKDFTHKQSARAANLTVIKQIYYRDVFREGKAQPITMGGIPMCSKQYIDISTLCRVPRKDCDISQKIDYSSDYIVIWYRNVWYKLQIFRNNKCLKPFEIQKAIEDLMANHQEPTCEEEGKIGALTTMNRDEYAEIRDKYLMTAHNRRLVEMIQNAKDLVFLTEDDDPMFDAEDPTVLEKQYKMALGGEGYLLWMDRPTTNVINKRGKYRSNCEHGVADALTVCHIIEYFKYYESEVEQYKYDAKGDCIDQEIEFVPKAERMHWQIDDGMKVAINKSLHDATQIIDDVESASLVFTEYGKDHMKSIGVSPDAYIQMALQLTYYKDQGSFELTYEAALSRLFMHGRTETVRSCSQESCDFARAMLDPLTTRDDRLRLLKIACDKHQNAYKSAMAGDACDRHLFAMYVVAKYLNIDSPFLNRALGAGWKLSTSQTPQHQVPEMIKKLNQNPELFWAAGAFPCPHPSSNYGVCYTVGAGGNQLSFHIASWKHLENTSASRFRDTLHESLMQMRALSLQTPRASVNNFYNRQITVLNALHQYKSE